jgi:hypothetical protein
MAIFPRDILLAVKSALVGSSHLTYVDTVVIMSYKPEDIPDFTSYCIVINPVVVSSEFYEANQRYIAMEVQLVLLSKIGSRSEEDAMVADTPPSNVGIVVMYEDVYRTLYGNNLGAELELYPHLEELDVNTSLNVIEGERDTFIMEAKMGYRPRGLRWVNLQGV